MSNVTNEQVKRALIDLANIAFREDETPEFTDRI